MSGPLPMPPTTINDLLLLGRLALLDSAVGPFVAPPAGPGNPRLQDVRIRGRGLDPQTGAAYGTIDWLPGTAGWPCAVLTAFRKAVTYPVTGQSWETWTCYLHLALAPEADAGVDPMGWATLWDAQLQQWFPFHRRFNAPYLQAGDVWWEYRGAEIRPFLESGVGCAGMIGTLVVRNTVPALWGV